MKLIVGLGNPGAKFARHRHNVGFMATTRIADRQGLGLPRDRFHGRVRDGDIGGVRCLVLEPATYMNDSGRSVAEACRFHKIEPADVIVLHDEIDLAPGKLKVKTGGGNAGHNGLRSISAHIGNDYVRVRIGVGHPGHKDAVHGYVLHDFAKADLVWLEPLLDAMADAAAHLVAGDNSRFMTEVSRQLAPPDGAKEPRPASKSAMPRETREPLKAPSPPEDAPAATALSARLGKWLRSRKGSE
jgi:PTH1 family peptidyl-tRNA hydrolase